MSKPGDNKYGDFKDLVDSTGTAPGRAYFKSNNKAVDLLGSITAADKASSIPYVNIWQIDDKGQPVHPDQDGKPIQSIMIQTIEPPSFGRSVDQFDIFRERPPVSLESIKIKNEMSYGMIMWRKIDLSFVVHRPSVIFGEGSGQHDAWSSLLSVGNMHTMEYGWAGASQNPFLNGDGMVEKGGGNEVEGRKRINFVTVNYSFSIGSDGQISIQISALENGENTLSLMTLGDIDNISAPTNPKKKHRVGDPISIDGMQKIQNDIHKLSTKEFKKYGNSIALGDILDKIFAPLIKGAFSKSGYAGTTNLRLGFFNGKCPAARKNFGGTVAGGSIGDFMIPEKTVKTILAEIVKTGAQLKLMDTLQRFLNVAIDPQSYFDSELTDSEKKQVKKDSNQNREVEGIKTAAILEKHVMPDIKVKIASFKEGGKLNAYFYIFDLKEEIVRFNPQDRFDKDKKPSRDEIKKVLDEHGIPIISFRNGLSFVQDARFEVEQDPAIKAILIQEGYKNAQNPQEITKMNSAAKKDNAIDIRKLLYSSALQGTITMFGNFVFDTFSLVWLEFGVKQWDGPFYAMGKEDSVSRGEFSSQITFRSAGDDPLGTQGRPTQEERQARQEQDAKSKAKIEQSKKPTAQSKSKKTGGGSGAKQ